MVGSGSGGDISGGRGECVVVVARVVAEGKTGRERREWMDGLKRGGNGWMEERRGEEAEAEEWPSSPCASSLSVRSNLDPSILLLSVLC